MSEKNTAAELPADAAEFSANVKEVEAAQDNPSGTAAKSKKKRSGRRFPPLFYIIVIIPTLCSIAYFGFIAADRYVSESSFVVRSAKGQSATSGFGALLQTAGFARSQDDTYTVREYMQSRSALNSLSKTIPVRSFYEEKGDIFSRFNGFGLRGEQEAFYLYYTGKVHIDFDAVSGISILRVESFDAKESNQINGALLKQGESLINQLNERARNDTVRYAENAVEIAENRVKEAAGQMTEYRNKHGIFDLKAQSEVQMNLVSKLQDELILIQTQLDQVKAVTPENPQIPGLIAREKSLRKEINAQMRAISGKGDKSLSSQAAEYQRIFLENELAEKQLAAAMTALESAKADADMQQLYLEIVEQPSEPDLAQKPTRIYNIAATFVIGLIIYGIVSLLAASIREHKN